MGWMAPAPGVAAPRWCCHAARAWSHHDGDHDRRPRPGQERLSGSRDRQHRRSGRPALSKTGSGDPVLQQAPALSRRYGGVRHEPLLARELVGLGHEVRLMPPAYVKPYVKRGKTDAGDAEAICEAVTRPTMRFVAIKSVEQQAALALHRTRDLLVRQRTQLVNMIRGLLAEFGIAVPKGITNALAFVRRAAAAHGHFRA